MKSHITKLDNQWLIAPPELAVSPQWFEPSYWQAQALVIGQSHGRNVTWFVGKPTSPMVLRHYYRGGLIAKLVTDSYLFTGLESTRAYREYVLLKELERRELPACRVVAARVIKKGICYQADLLMKLVEGGKDLVALLSQDKLSTAQWQAIGCMIAQFHRQGVYHADLNAHNILLDGAQQPCLIDFDRGEIKAEKGQWCQDNLDRLLRSFNKEKGKLPTFHFSSDDWESLLQGYRLSAA